MPKCNGCQNSQFMRGIDPVEYDAEGRAVGMRYHVSTFGIFGFALLSSVTMLDAVNVALRFWDLSFALALPVVVAEEGRVRISLSTDGVPSDVAAFVHGRDSAAVETVLGELLPSRPPPRFVDGVLEVGTDYLSSPLPQGDARTRAMYEGMCEELAQHRLHGGGVPPVYEGRNVGGDSVGRQADPHPALLRDDDR